MVAVGSKSFQGRLCFRRISLVNSIAQVTDMSTLISGGVTLPTLAVLVHSVRRVVSDPQVAFTSLTVMTSHQLHPDRSGATHSLVTITRGVVSGNLAQKLHLG
jgi:hypothetical protein